MTYRTRIYNHRNAQSPEGEKKKKPFFSSRLDGAAADEKQKFFHTAAGDASRPPQLQRLATSAIDERAGTNEEKEARNKGDKLRQEESAGGGRTVPTLLRVRPRVQRDLAIAPDVGVADPVLTKKEIHDAILYNNNRYTEPSIRLIQDIVGGPKDGVMSEQTVRLIALYQAQNHLKADGMAGPDTFGQLSSELGAENVSPDTCLNSILVRVTPPQLSIVAPGRVRIKGSFAVEVRFDPHCDCSRFQYRQWISGDVTRNGSNVNHWISHLPGGRLPGMGNWIEDGDNTLPANGPYGHRNLQPNLGGVLDQYVGLDGTTPDLKKGCIYQNNDSAGVDNGAGVHGDHFVLDMRFMGEIRRDGKPIEKRFWAIRGNFNVP
ncbi:MAG TPA: peptidoglycan-binding domain-containing protein [Puia sp.]|nr:peptidoglycan-binding domain-containing protein [Puia sp.]